MKRCAVLIVLIFLCALTISADTEKWEFSTFAAREAKRNFEQALLKADTDYQQKVAEAQNRLLSELDGAMNSATQSDNMQEIRQIKSAIEEIEKDRKQGFHSSKRHPVGIWRVVYTTGAVRLYKVERDGTVHRKENGKEYLGKLNRTNSDLLLDFKDGRIERLTFVRNQLFVEHFQPVEEYPHQNARIMGRGVPSDEY